MYQLDRDDPNIYDCRGAALRIAFVATIGVVMLGALFGYIATIAPSASAGVIDGIMIGLGGAVALYQLRRAFCRTCSVVEVRDQLVTWRVLARSESSRISDIEKVSNDALIFRRRSGDGVTIQSARLCSVTVRGRGKFFLPIRSASPPRGMSFADLLRHFGAAL